MAIYKRWICGHFRYNRGDCYHGFGYLFTKEEQMRNQAIMLLFGAGLILFLVFRVLKVYREEHKLNKTE
ncbi:MAG: hypothetical protein ACTTH5_05325 [Wolinella sp.]